MVRSKDASWDAHHCPESGSLEVAEEVVVGKHRELVSIFLKFLGNCPLQTQQLEFHETILPYKANRSISVTSET